MTKNTYPYFIKDFKSVNNTTQYWFKSFKVYLAYREMIKEQIHKYAFEQSFTGQFLVNGFVPTMQKKINPTNNWFGISTYHPDEIFVNGKKKVIMSLQGILCDINPCDTHMMGVAKNMGLKYIKMQNGNDIVYENYYGQLPSKEIVQSFLNVES
jgi:uncharacterized HAD superfamily protein